VVVLAIVLILFGAGRVPSAMGDRARVRAFRPGVREDNAAEVGAEQLVKAQPGFESRPARWLCATSGRSNMRVAEKFGRARSLRAALEMTDVHAR
jgi:Sec-independent protein translocase protein TatA